MRRIALMSACVQFKINPSFPHTGTRLDGGSCIRTFGSLRPSQRTAHLSMLIMQRARFGGQQLEDGGQVSMMNGRVPGRAFVYLQTDHAA